MNFLRQHWFDAGLGLAALAGLFLAVTRLSPLNALLWVSLITLWLHQFEEYRYPGYFPGLVNTVMFASRRPERYPLNPQTALIVNAGVGWLSYGLAAVFGERAIWLAMATVLVSAGNVAAHGVLFNLKGRTVYNPGLATALLLFVPVVIVFFALVLQGRLATPLDWVAGIGLGALLNYLGVIKLIDWLKDENTPYAFPARSAQFRRSFREWLSTTVNPQS